MRCLNGLIAIFLGYLNGFLNSLLRFDCEFLKVPAMSMNCFGFDALLTGQNLVPDPPAMITQ
jgi:hypothetical protein